MSQCFLKTPEEATPLEPPAHTATASLSVAFRVPYEVPYTITAACKNVWHFHLCILHLYIAKFSSQTLCLDGNNEGISNGKIWLTH